MKIETPVPSLEQIIKEMELWADDSIDASRLGRLSAYWLSGLQKIYVPRGKEER